MNLDLAGKRALVLGASRGIGLAIARSLLDEGARVCLAARGAEGLAAASASLGGAVETVVCDAATESGAKSAVTYAAGVFDGLDVLVNNAGGSLGTGTFERVESPAWRAVVDLNLMSAVWASQAAVALMRAQGAGVIVHVASVYGREYGPTAPYVAAKSALIALAKEMAIDLAPYGIRVNSVAPGSVMFPGGSWDKRRTTDPARVAKVIEEIPWRRFGTAEEIASVVAFLCSSKASWVTGVCVPVDGGQGRAL